MKLLKLSAGLSSLCILNRLPEGGGKLSGIVITLKVLDPEIETIEIVVGWVARIPPKISEVVKYDERSIFFLLDKARILNDLD